MSGRKEVLKRYQLVTAQDASVDIISNPVDVTFQDNAGLQISWTGTPTGVLTIDASIDGITYIPLTFTPNITQPSGSANTGFLVDLNQFPYPLYQVHYVASSGAGTMSVWVCGKAI